MAEHDKDPVEPEHANSVEPTEPGQKVSIPSETDDDGTVPAATQPETPAVEHSPEQPADEHSPQPEPELQPQSELDVADPVSLPGRRRKWPWVVGIILLLLLAGIGSAVYYVYAALQPLKASAQPVRVQIAQGSGVVRIAQILESKGLIRNAQIFGAYLKYNKQGSRFQAGEYDLTPGMTIDQLIDKLNKGDTVKAEMLRFTIPEGYTLKQIAEKLGEQKAADPAAFLKLTDNPSSVKSNWTAGLASAANLMHPLEGYLFPETYEMKKGSTETDILGRLIAEWDRKTDQLPPDWQDKMRARGLSFHQLLTVASLIEKEVVVESERPMVAGVIYNRMQKKMPLQIDATVQYLFDKPKDRLFEKDLQTESPYNTYLHTGLPPGPIANPGLASVKAALYPADTKYLFYVTRKDGSHTHLFAETFEEHKKNIAASLKEEKPQ